METKNPIPLLCQFCGTQTGEYTPPKRYGGLQLDPKQFGFVDIRCTPCEDVHGKYKTHAEN